MPSAAVSPSPWLLVGFVVAVLVLVVLVGGLWWLSSAAPVRSREDRAVDLVRDQRFFERACDEVGLFVADETSGVRTYPRRFEIEPKHRGGRTIRPAWGEFGVEQPLGWSREEMERALERLVDSIGSEHVDAEFYLVGTGTWCVRLDGNDGAGEMYTD